MRDEAMMEYLHEKAKAELKRLGVPLSVRLHCVQGNHLIPPVTYVLKRDLELHAIPADVFRGSFIQVHMEGIPA